MNEAYAEWLVKRKTPFYAYILTAFMAIVTLISIFFALTGGVISVIIMFAAGFATYILYRNFNVEYEYLYVGGHLSIDKIMGKAKRKKAWEASMEEIKVIAPSDSYVLKDYRVSGSKKMDFSSGVPGVKTYTVIHQSGANATEIMIEPNDKMLQCFRQTVPRKVVQ